RQLAVVALVLAGGGVHLEVIAAGVPGAVEVPSPHVIPAVLGLVAVPDHDELTPRTHRDPGVLLVVGRVRIHKEGAGERSPLLAEALAGHVGVVPSSDVVPV